MKKLVMFDLDGTLINSAGGIANSVNTLCRRLGIEEIPEKTIIEYTGDGAKKLLERSFAGRKLPCPIDEAVNMMVQIYAENPVVNTFLYPGVREGLQKLHDAGYLLAVVSNKPRAVSDKILAALDIRHLFCENIGGGDFPLKPAPDALLFLMEKYQVSKENAWMAGDNHTDINAAANAGIKSIFLTCGFGTKNGSVPSFEAESFDVLTGILL